MRCLLGDRAWASWSSGSTSSASSASSTARGIPYTVHVSASREDPAAAATDRVGTLEAVVAHSGHHDEQRSLAEDACGVARSSGRRADAGRRSRARRCRLHAPVGGEAQVLATGREQGDAPDRAARRRRLRGRCSVELWSRRAASDLVKPAGMCCTISVPMPSCAGSCGMQLGQRPGPPVEVAISTALRTLERTGRRRRGPGVAGGARRRVVRLAGRLGAGRAASSDLLDERSPRTRRGPRRPRAWRPGRRRPRRARRPRARPVWARRQRRRSPASSGRPGCCRARRTPMPSRPGIARSSISASGCSRSHAASASSPFAALPTIWTPARDERRGDDLSHHRAVVGDDDAGAGCWSTSVVVPSSTTAACAARSPMPEKIVLGLSRTTRRSSSLAIASISSESAPGTSSKSIVLDGQDLFDLVDDHAGGLVAGLDDHDLRAARSAPSRARGGRRGHRRGRCGRAG